jgi:hypothetical protein
MVDIPCSQDFDPSDSLDASAAREQFLGKSKLEATAMFADNVLLYGESLSHMCERPALFYGSALLDYVNSESSRGNECAAAALLGAADSWLESGFDLTPIETELRCALHRIRSQLSFYAPERMTQRIYHQLPGDARRILQRLDGRVRA